MSTSRNDGPPVRRIDRILAFMSLGIVMLSIVCFLAVIIASAAGVPHEAMGEGAWPMVSMIVMIGPIIAFVLLLVLLVMSFIRRGRANRG
ncbi:hypothetical protein [Microbacterium indicum]|uniref:hypothetical protein n=1 Tax=Microbacterium indicum TaxID=358100 RepID=UPI00048CAA56|nr:hypothetical protein [Microbacterium indicum]